MYRVIWASSQECFTRVMIIETYGKGSFFGGDPEFVDQEGIHPTAWNSRSSA